MGDSVPNFFGGQGGGASGLSFGGGASFGADAGPLFEMKCGKLVRDGAKMRADPRRGTLKIVATTYRSNARNYDGSRRSVSNDLRNDGKY